MKAWELLSKRGAWTTETEALDEYGYKVPPRSADAISWCALGAIDKCYPPSKVERIVRKVAKELGDTSGDICFQEDTVAEFNDAQKKKTKVVNLLKKLDI